MDRMHTASPAPGYYVDRGLGTPGFAMDSGMPPAPSSTPGITGYGGFGHFESDFGEGMPSSFHGGAASIAKVPRPSPTMPGSDLRLGLTSSQAAVATHSAISPSNIGSSVFSAIVGSGHMPLEPPSILNDSGEHDQHGIALHSSRGVGFRVANGASAPPLDGASVDVDGSAAEAHRHDGGGSSASRHYQYTYDADQHDDDDYDAADQAPHKGRNKRARRSKGTASAAGGGGGEQDGTGGGTAASGSTAATRPRRAMSTGSSSGGAGAAGDGGSTAITTSAAVEQGTKAARRSSVTGGGAPTAGLSDVGQTSDSNNHDNMDLNASDGGAAAFAVDSGLEATPAASSQAFKNGRLATKHVGALDVSDDGPATGFDHAHEPHFASHGSGGGAGYGGYPARSSPEDGGAMAAVAAYDNIDNSGDGIDGEQHNFHDQHAAGHGVGDDGDAAHAGPSPAAADAASSTPTTSAMAAQTAATSATRPGKARGGGGRKSTGSTTAATAAGGAAGGVGSKRGRDSSAGDGAAASSSASSAAAGACGVSKADNDSTDLAFFELNEFYYAEIKRRADAVVASGAGSYSIDLDSDTHGYRGLLRRKSAYIWQTRMMFDRISIHAGHFEHPLLAAVAYDVGQTFLRPSLRNANGTIIELNFPGTASDCRVNPIQLVGGLRVVQLAKPGVPIEEGHFWGKDEAYYKEIRRRADIIESSGLAAARTETEGQGCFVGIQKHKRKLDGNIETFTYEAKLIHRRKWFYLGRFRSGLEAAVAYDYGTTFLRPYSVKDDGARAALNFPGAVSDCRVEGPIDAWPADVKESINNGGAPLPAPRTGGKANAASSPLQQKRKEAGAASTSSASAAAGAGAGNSAALPSPAHGGGANAATAAGSGKNRKSLNAGAAAPSSADIAHVHSPAPAAALPASTPSKNGNAKVPGGRRSSAGSSSASATGGASAAVMISSSSTGVTQLVAHADLNAVGPSSSSSMPLSAVKPGRGRSANQPVTASAAAGVQYTQQGQSGSPRYYQHPHQHPHQRAQHQHGYEQVGAADHDPGAYGVYEPAQLRQVMHQQQAQEAEQYDFHVQQQQAQYEQQQQQMMAMSMMQQQAAAPPPLQYTASAHSGRMRRPTQKAAEDFEFHHGVIASKRGTNTNNNNAGKRNSKGGVGSMGNEYSRGHNSQQAVSAHAAAASSGMHARGGGSDGDGAGSGSAASAGAASAGGGINSAVSATSSAGAASPAHGASWLLAAASAITSPSATGMRGPSSSSAGASASASSAAGVPGMAASRSTSTGSVMSTLSASAVGSGSAVTAEAASGLNGQHDVAAAAQQPMGAAAPAASSARVSASRNTAISPHGHPMPSASSSSNAGSALRTGAVATVEHASTPSAGRLPPTASAAPSPAQQQQHKPVLSPLDAAAAAAAAMHAPPVPPHRKDTDLSVVSDGGGPGMGSGSNANDDGARTGASSSSSPAQGAASGYSSSSAAAAVHGTGDGVVVTPHRRGLTGNTSGMGVNGSNAGAATALGVAFGLGSGLNGQVGPAGVHAHNLPHLKVNTVRNASLGINGMQRGGGGNAGNGAGGNGVTDSPNLPSGMASVLASPVREDETVSTLQGALSILGGAGGAVPQMQSLHLPVHALHAQAGNGSSGGAGAAPASAAVSSMPFQQHYSAHFASMPQHATAIDATSGQALVAVPQWMMLQAMHHPMPMHQLGTPIGPHHQQQQQQQGVGMHQVHMMPMLQQQQQHMPTPMVGMPLTNGMIMMPMALSNGSPETATGIGSSSSSGGGGAGYVQYYGMPSAYGYLQSPMPPPAASDAATSNALPMGQQQQLQYQQFSQYGSSPPELSPPMHQQQYMQQQLRGGAVTGLASGGSHGSGAGAAAAGAAVHAPNSHPGSGGGMQQSVSPHIAQTTFAERADGTQMQLRYTAAMMQHTDVDQGHVHGGHCGSGRGAGGNGNEHDEGSAQDGEVIGV